LLLMQIIFDQIGRASYRFFTMNLRLGKQQLPKEHVLLPTSTVPDQRIPFVQSFPNRHT
jgi:hypothetical protein